MKILIITTIFVVSFICAGQSTKPTVYPIMRYIYALVFLFGAFTCMYLIILLLNFNTKY